MVLRYLDAFQRYYPEKCRILSNENARKRVAKVLRSEFEQLSGRRIVLPKLDKVGRFGMFNTDCAAAAIGRPTDKAVEESCRVVCAILLTIGVSNGDIQRKNFGGLSRQRLFCDDCISLLPDVTRRQQVNQMLDLFTMLK